MKNWLTQICYIGLMTLKTLIFSGVFLLSVSNVFGQDILTNKSIVEMVKSGLSGEIIIAKIKSTSVSFDTSTEALKMLSEAGVPESVVIAMITEDGKAAKAAVQDAKERSKVMESVPEQGKLKDIINKNNIFILTNDLKSRDIIEKELAKIKKFKIVDKLENSDFVIKYESWVETLSVSATVVGQTATARENNQLVGLLTVVMPSDEPGSGRVRQIYTARKTKYFVWEDNPAESATKQFIKDLVRTTALSPK